MIPADETFDGTWPYTPHFFNGSGFAMHYVDEGEGDPILMLHGEPTWGYLYRNFVGPLLPLGRVIIPDHMGFGKSETPQDREYSIRDHVDNLERLVDHLGLRNITLVAQDWGGPIGAMLSLRRPELFARFCYMNTGVPARPPAGVPLVSDYPWFKWVQTDEAHATLSNLGATALSVLKRIGFERTGIVNETWVRAYSAPFPTPADCKGALAFPASIGAAVVTELMLENIANVPAVAALPAMYVHGEEDRAVPTDMAVGMFRSLWPQGPVTTLPGVGHFLQEDAPEAVTALIGQFIQMTRT